MIVFPGQSKSKCVLSCLLCYGPGNTVTDRPLAIEIVPIKALKDENRPERFPLSLTLHTVRVRHTLDTRYLSIEILQST